MAIACNDMQSGTVTVIWQPHASKMLAGECRHNDYPLFTNEVERAFAVLHDAIVDGSTATSCVPVITMRTCDRPCTPS